jgi:MFS family permease
MHDLFFLHERGTQAGVQAVWLSLGSSLAPVIAGFLIQDAGWRWFQWLCAILAGVDLVLIILFVPETQYPRDLHKALDIAGIGEDVVGEDASEDAREDTAEKTINKAAPDLRSETVERVSAPSTVAVPKKSFLAELMPWSPVRKDVSLLGAFLRPWATWAYPSMVWGVLSFSIHVCW